MASSGLKAKIPGWALIPAIFSLLVYLNAVGNDFTFDDEISVRQNRCIQDAPLSDVFKRDIWCLEGAGSTGSYRPLTLLMHRVVYGHFGLVPGAFRMLNVLGYFLCVLLAGLLAGRVLPERRSAMLAGLIFALHPVHSEAVNYISAFSEVGACLFVLAAVYLYSFVSESRHPHRLRFAALFLVAVGMLFKESAVTALGVFAVFDLRDCLVRSASGSLYSSCRHKAAGILAFYAFCSFALLAYLFLRFELFGSFSAIVKAEDNPIAGQPWDVYYGTAFSAVAEYLRLLVFPFSLSVDYSFNQIPLLSLSDNLLVLWPALLMLLSLFAALLLMRKCFAVSFSILFFWITFSIASNLFICIPALFAERQLLLPSFGFCLLMGGGLGYLASLLKKNARSLLWFAIVLLLMAGSWRIVLRNIDWSGNMALFYSAVQETPDSYKARKNLGHWYRKAAHFDLALEQYRAAEKILNGRQDDFLDLELALSLHGIGDFEAASGLYEKLLRDNPQDATIKALIKLSGEKLIPPNLNEVPMRR